MLKTWIVISRASVVVCLWTLMVQGEPLLARGAGEVGRLVAQAREGAEEACSKPYLKIIKPKAASVGDEVILRGHRLGSEEGRVALAGNLSAEVVFWRNTRIKITVPKGAVSGGVIVVKKCGRASNSEYLRIREAEEEEGSTEY